MKKFTKIVATIGPSSDTPEMIEKLINAGVNIFRLNFKHNVVEWHGERAQRVKDIADRMGVPVATLIDLQGPEIRINMPFDSIDLTVGERIVIGKQVFETKEKGFSITHAEIVNHLTVGQRLLADDGSFVFFVERENGTTYLRSHREGKLLNRKSLNIPGSNFPLPVLIERDYQGLQLAINHKIDYIALSFVRFASDIQTLRQEMHKLNLHAKIVSKIETQQAVDNLSAIVDESDAMMVARGDLAIEVSYEQVPYYQKLLIRECVQKGIPIITATQMLQSMVSNPSPTRAEISDVANAVYDLTDAIMLSGETASGKYPLETVEIMACTASFHEKQFHKDNRTLLNYNTDTQDATMSDTAYNLYLQSNKNNENIAGFLVFTKSGETARLFSRYRPHVPIYAFAPSQAVQKSLAINYGVVPFVIDIEHQTRITAAHVQLAIAKLLEEGLIDTGKKLIVLHGDEWGSIGGISTIKLVTV